MSGEDRDRDHDSTQAVQELDGVRIGAALASFLLGALVVRLISQGQSPARILLECVLIGAVVYLLTVVVRPPRSRAGSGRQLEPVAVQPVSSESASRTVPEAMNASISASDFPS